MLTNIAFEYFCQYSLPFLNTIIHTHSEKARFEF